LAANFMDNIGMSELGIQNVGLSKATVRVATADDRDAIRRLVNAAFGVERRIKRGGADRLDDDPRELAMLMERGVFLLREDEGELIACVYLELRGERCYLGLLSIAAERQGAGLGRQMMAAAESYAQEQGAKWVDLRVVSPRREELVSLYARLGYDEQGTAEYPEALAEKMVEPGHFVVMAKAL
jgi:GNAT superfamily N-acetyltransferase